MPKNKHFITRAKTQLKTLHSELKALEKAAACDTSKSQLQKLHAELQRFGAAIDAIAKGIKSRGQAPANQIKADAESHGLALETVIAAYREMLSASPAHA